MKVRTIYMNHICFPYTLIDFKWYTLSFILHFINQSNILSFHKKKKIYYMNIIKLVIHNINRLIS